MFPRSRSGDVLDRSDRQPMARHAVPSADSKLKVSNPKPDMLFGYSRHAAFLQQQAQLISMGSEMVATSQNLIYPFFVVEFKGDGPSGGGALWVATNQCLGGAASCVNIAERLNRQLEQCESDQVRPFDGAAFSIAMSGTEARLCISWKHDELRYYMANVKSFLLQRPDHYLEFVSTSATSSTGGRTSAWARSGPAWIPSEMRAGKDPRRWQSPRHHLLTARSLAAKRAGHLRVDKSGIQGAMHPRAAVSTDPLEPVRNS